MAFDSAAFRPVVAAAPEGDAVESPCPVWAARNPDRALALLFVTPQDCAAVDVVTSLEG